MPDAPETTGDETLQTSGMKEDTGPSPQRHVPIIQKFQKIAETPQVVQRQSRSSRRSRRLLRHHRYSCGRCRGSSSSRRRLSTRGVLVIQSSEDRVRPRQVQDIDMIVDFPLVLQHQVQTILTIQRQWWFPRASSLIVVDLPGMGQ